MPNAIVITLQRTNDAPLPAAIGESTHGAFFALLKEANPELAARLHANPERKPFTLSAPREERRERPRAGQSADLRVTFLDDSLFPLLGQTLLDGGLQAGFRIGQARFLLTGMLTTSGSHPEAGHATCAEMRESAEPAETVAVRFASPTVFRSEGRDFHWPAPRQVWQSWARAWNTCAGRPYNSATPEGHGSGVQRCETEVNALLIDEPRIVDLAGTRVTVERYELSTRHVTLSAGGLNGFMGTCVYGLKALAEEDRRIFALLTDFAFYAGTGRKTAMALGQTSRMAPDGTNS